MGLLVALVLSPAYDDRVRDCHPVEHQARGYEACSYIRQHLLFLEFVLMVPISKAASIWITTVTLIAASPRVQFVGQRSWHVTNTVVSSVDLFVAKRSAGFEPNSATRVYILYSYCGVGCEERETG